MREHELASALSLSLALEAAAYPKPGNVHRASDLPGMSFEEFLAASAVSVHFFELAARRGARGRSGRVVFADLLHSLVAALMRAGAGNVCLGSCLLLFPLAVGGGSCIPRVSAECAVEGAARALREATPLDTAHFYASVRLAAPSYLGRQDYTGPYPNVWDRNYWSKIVRGGIRLWDVLEFSAGRDLVARELVRGYELSRRASAKIAGRLAEHGNWNRAVVEAYVWLLSEAEDTLVARKLGRGAASKIRERASRVLEEVLSRGEDWMGPVMQLDSELRGMGANPGSAADIVAAAIALTLIDSSGADGLRLPFSQGKRSSS
ncbi:MAG: triphosphoribosyl-dephospho-CoA synthase [Desulfurococcaceae archaeon]